MCATNTTYWQDLLAKQTFFFDALCSLEFGYAVNYGLNVCPQVFMNTNLKGLIFRDVANSLIYKNQLGFVDLNAAPSKYDLNTHNLTNVEFSLYYEELTLKTMDKFVFRNVKSLCINGILPGIQPELFAYFTRMRTVTLRIDNFKEFFHKGNVIY